MPKDPDQLPTEDKWGASILTDKPLSERVEWFYGQYVLDSYGPINLRHEIAALECELEEAKANHDGACEQINAQIKRAEAAEQRADDAELNYFHAAELTRLRAEIERLKVWGSDSHVTELETALAEERTMRKTWEKKAMRTTVLERELAEAKRHMSLSPGDPLHKTLRDLRERAEAAEHTAQLYADDRAEALGNLEAAERRYADLVVQMGGRPEEVRARLNEAEQRAREYQDKITASTGEDIAAEIGAQEREIARLRAENGRLKKNLHIAEGCLNDEEDAALRAENERLND